MADYVWELGFDFDHLNSYDGTCDLQLGLVKDYAVNPGDDPDWGPASPYLIKPNESVTFHAYDLTDSSIWDETTLNAVVIEFSAARAGDRPTPFGDGEIALNPKFVDAGTNTSTYFTGERPFFKPEGNQEWVIDEAAENSHLNMMITVIVTKKKIGGAYETRKFVVDPEMVIDSQGELDPKS